ncbi:MAG: IS200/IS605 family transposase [Cellulosilyticum sp.]|nr:IS200/IS605 family transposase [Cellulosilyticum sp.]
MKNEIKTTAHSTYRCQYHIVFAPKYRRKVIYNELRADIGQILRKLCNEKKVELIEAEACPDHIHMLVSIPPYLSVAQFMGFIKSKSALMIFDRHANLKYKYGKRSFWARGYYADTVGKNEKMIREYIQNQLEEDYMSDQISLKEYIDPFTGTKRE